MKNTKELFISWMNNVPRKNGTPYTRSYFNMIANKINEAN